MYRPGQLPIFDIKFWHLPREADECIDGIVSWLSANFLGTIRFKDNGISFSSSLVYFSLLG